MRRAWIYPLLLLILAAVIYWGGPILPKPVLLALIGAVFLISISFKVLMIRRSMQKMNMTVMTPVQRASNILVLAAAGVVLMGIILVIAYQRDTGHFIMNLGLGLFLAGIILGMTAPAGNSKPLQDGLITRKQTVIFRNISYCCIIMTITGLLLEVNRYHVQWLGHDMGWMFVLAGMAGIFINIFGIIGYLKYTKNRLQRQKM